MTIRRFLPLLIALFAVVDLGCDPDPPSPAPKDEEKKAEDKTPPAKRVQLAPNLALEVQGDTRRVVLDAAVCLKTGALELLLTRKNTKEHEAILTVDVDARELHKALLLAKAEAGSTVKFDPKYEPAKGQEIRITLQYQEKGKTVTVDAREWIREHNTKKTLQMNWVFAGSRLIKNPLDDGKVIFLANDGDLVCVSNFDTALLDLPIKSSKDEANLVWETNSDKIPEVGTKVTVIMEPIPKKKK